LTCSSERRLPSCVLTFHRVVNMAEKDHDVEWPSFRRLVRSLDSTRVTTDLVLAPEMSDAIVLTFDDATSDHMIVGEELAALGLRAIFFVPPLFVGYDGRLTMGDIKLLVSLGHEIAGHGFSHSPMDRMTKAQIDGEIRQCVDYYRERIGIQVKTFAPPGGRTNTALVNILKQYGFEANRTMRWGIYESSLERWDIPCVPVTSLTINRGWVESALTKKTLPLSMRIGWIVKQMMPYKLRARARSIVTQWF